MSRIIDFAAPLGQKAGPGRWNDLDMLEIGNGGMSRDEYGMSTPRFRVQRRSDEVICSDTFLNVGIPQESVDIRK